MENYGTPNYFSRKKRQNKSGARTIDTKHRPVSKSSRRTVSASLEQYCHHRRGHDNFSILSAESLNQIRLQLFFRTALKMSPRIVVFNINGNESSGKCRRIDHPPALLSDYRPDRNMSGNACGIPPVNESPLPFLHAWRKYHRSRP